MSVRSRMNRPLPVLLLALLACAPSSPRITPMSVPPAPSRTPPAEPAAPSAPAPESGPSPEATLAAVPSSAPPVSAPMAADTIAKARDPRRCTQAPRPRSAIVVELNVLESRRAAAPPNAPPLPALLRGLADGYSELAHAAHNDGGARGAAIEKTARSKAIGFYGALASLAPAQPDLDALLYYEALEHEAASELVVARRGYAAIAPKFPQSRLLPLIDFAFGELLLAEAADDPSKLPLAIQAYAQVAKSPKSAIAACAWLRTGQVYERLGDTPRAKAAYERVFRDYPGSDAAADVPANMRP